MLCPLFFLRGSVACPEMGWYKLPRRNGQRGLYLCFFPSVLPLHLMPGLTKVRRQTSGPCGRRHVGGNCASVYL